MKKTIVQHISLTDSDEDAPVPPEQLVRNYKSIQQWLTAMCDGESPQKLVSLYELGVFESKTTRVLFFVGKHKSGNDKTIVFKPKDLYYLLPDEYVDLSQEQLDNKLISQLVDFTRTDFFSNCYLAQADSVLFRGNILIWSNPK